MMRKSLVSIVALGLFAGAPVMAESTNNEAKNQSTQHQTQQQSTQQQSTQQQSTQQQSTQQQGTQQTGALSDQQFQEMLSGYEERSDLEGRIARAMTADGNDVFVLVGPRNLEPGDSFEAQDSDIRDRFEGAGFTGVQDLGDARIARANLDEDHYIFAFSADHLSRSGMQTGGLSGETGSDIGQDETQVGEMDTGSETGQSDLGQSDLSQSDLQQSDTDTTTEMGQTEMDMDPETGTTGQAGTDLGEDDAQLGQMDSETEQGQSGTGIGESTQLGQMDSETEQGQSGTGIGEGTQLGQTDTETEQGQTGTGIGESTQLGQMDSETEQGQTGTGIGEGTQLGQMDTETEQGQTGTGIGQDDTQVGQMDSDAETGQIGRGLSEADADRMASDIEGAGIQNADQFEGQVVRATSNGSPVFFLITSRDMSAEVDVSEDEVRQKLQQADLQDIEFVDDVTLVRGDFEDDSVFVLAGDLMGRGIQQ